MSREYTTKLIDLVDEGVIDWETVARAALHWMSESDVEEMCDRSHDLEGLFEDDDPEPDPEVDGLQYRYIIRDESPITFKAEIFLIDEDGDDSVKPVYTITDVEYNNNPEIDWHEPEESIDYWISEIDHGEYACHYLGESDDVVMTD